MWPVDRRMHRASATVGDRMMSGEIRAALDSEGMILIADTRAAMAFAVVLLSSKRHPCAPD